MRRHDFTILLAGAMGGRPPAVRAQQKAMPVIGYLHYGSPGSFARFMAAFHSHVRLFQMQASEFVACEQALVLGSAGQGRRRGR
jgi:hypothetical protein